MNIFEQSLASLDAFLEATSKEKLIEIFQKVSLNEYEGPTMLDYFTQKGKCSVVCVRMPDGTYAETLFSSPPGSYIIPEKKNPDLLGVLRFLCNIAI